jgi:hypothetical protein
MLEFFVQSLAKTTSDYAGDYVFVLSMGVAIVKREYDSLDSDDERVMVWVKKMSVFSQLIFDHCYGVL